MSRWTHIRGGFELDASPYESKPLKVSKPTLPRCKDTRDEWNKYWDEVHKKLYLPFPKEQVKVSIPRLITRFEGDSYNCVDAVVFSLPRAKKYIDEAINLLPQGEVGIRPSIKQDRYDSRSSSFGCEIHCVNKATKCAIEDMYNKSEKWGTFSFKELEKYFKVEIGCIDFVNNIIIGIREDVRDCSGLEFMEGLEKCFKYLEDHDISIEDGYLEWQDEYFSDYIFAWRKSRVSLDEVYKYMIIDVHTNQILYSKSYNYKKDENGKIDWETFGKEFEVTESNPGNIDLDALR